MYTYVRMYVMYRSHYATNFCEKKRMFPYYDDGWKGSKYILELSWRDDDLSAGQRNM